MTREYRSKVTANASTRTELSAQGRSLGRLPHESLQRPEARALGGKLWGGGDVHLSLGMPRALEAGALPKWLRPDDVMVELSRLPSDGASRAALLFPQTDAARWVDRALGGDGQIGRAAPLRPVEHGVLAYHLAQGLSELFPSLSVCDVDRAEASYLGSRLGSGVIWPMLLTTPLGRVDLRLLLSEALAASVPEEARLSLVLRDRLAREAWTALSAGDVLWSEALPLTLTTQGLVGELELCIEGCADGLAVRVDGDVVTASQHTLSERVPDSLELVLGQGSLRLLELAQAASGRPVSLGTPLPNERVSLHYPDAAPRLGELVAHRGGFGVRLLE